MRFPRLASRCFGKGFLLTAHVGEMENIVLGVDCDAMEMSSSIHKRLASIECAGCLLCWDSTDMSFVISSFYEMRRTRT